MNKALSFKHCFVWDITQHMTTNFCALGASVSDCFC